MTKLKRTLLIAGASIAGLAIVLIMAAVILLQTSWFSGFARTKLIAAIEDSTGGKVDVGSFQLDPWHLTVRIRKFVLHGTESVTDAPLAQIELLELHFKLFSGIAHLVDLAYLGVQTPQVHVLVRPDGTTNIPQPKKPSPPSNSNGLETLVNLKIGEFRIRNGLLSYAQRTTAFSGRGENLQALLQYNQATPGYKGKLSIDPLILTSANNPPLRVHIQVPVTIEANSVHLNNVSLRTDQSNIKLDASLENVNAPILDASLNASISLPELQHGFGLPLDNRGEEAPKTLTIELAAHSDDSSKLIQVRTARVALGQTNLEAYGAMRDPRDPSGSVRFQGTIALAQLSRLLKLSPTDVSGTLSLNGTAKLDAQNNYAANGTIESHALSVKIGDVNLSDLHLYVPFHADPYLISMDSLRLTALGGSLDLKLFLANMRQLSAEGNLRNFSLPVLASVLTGKPLNYSGNFTGSLVAKGDLRAKGTSGYFATARLKIEPGSKGVPVRGKIDATYSGLTDTVSVEPSFVALPHTQVDLFGAINKQLNLKLVSHNLNDFLPAANFGAQHQQAALPVSLGAQGVASIQAHVAGNLADPKITAHATIDRFSVQGRNFDHLGADLDASPGGAVLHDGSLTRATLRTTFDASLGLQKWSPVPNSPLTANLALQDSNLSDLASLAGQDPKVATGAGQAEVHIRGTYANPLGNASFRAADGSVYAQHFQQVDLELQLADRLITVAPLQISTDAGSLNMNARFQHPRDSFTTGDLQLHATTTSIQLARIEKLREQNKGIAGVLQLAADGAASVHEVNGQSVIDVKNIRADFSARDLRFNNQDAGNLTASASTENRTVGYRLNSSFAGSQIELNGRTQLSADYPTTASASIQNLAVSKVLSIAGQSDIPIAADLSANAKVSGTIKAPDANLTFDLAHANVYGEPIQELGGTVHYLNNLVDIPVLRVKSPAGSVSLIGSFRHAANDFQTGDLSLDVSSSDIQVDKIAHIHQAQPSALGTLHLVAGLSAAARVQNGKQAVRISRLNADAAATALQMNGHNLGQAIFTAKTNASDVHYQFDSNLADSQIHGSGISTLTGNYPTKANLSFKNIRYKNIAPFISQEPDATPGFEALVEGNATIDGPVLNTDALQARIQLDRLEAEASPVRSPTGAPSGKTVNIHNQGPIVVAMNGPAINVQHFRLEGPNTHLDVAGGVNLQNQAAPIDVTTDADIDLAMLGDVNHDVYSSGLVSMNAAVRGTFAQPLVNGQIELKNANLNYASLPNGLSNANGLIRLNGTSASIDNLTAESGGGKITLTGFAGLSGRAANFNLKAVANDVRVRYSGISVTSNASISLVGNTYRSLASGNVSIERVAYNSSSDAGSLLSSFASTPPSSPSEPSQLLTAMRLNINIITAPDLRVVTTYADRLSIEAKLTVRGTVATPGVLGRISVTDGQLVFFGNTYTVNTGTINFFNPVSIQPNINVSLQTLAQGVNVTLGVSGTMENLQLSYRSDPPLTFEQIVQLLATNTTPNDPNIVANQPPAPQQSFTQMGESAILGQAVANPLASRVQRVFGLSQFKIDPSVSGSNGQPSARVTLQEKIANNITFTYITDVTQTNNQIIRVEWDLTPKFSAVGLRDYNGNVSIEFFYGFTKR